jgi:hypothetical protein
MEDEQELFAKEVKQLVEAGDMGAVGDFLQNLSDASYRIGYKDAVKNYAVWSNGEQLVGTMRRPLKTVLDEVDKSSLPITY